MVHIVHIPRPDVKGLVARLRDRGEGCTRWTVRNIWSDWWFDNGPRLPKWGLDVYLMPYEQEDGTMTDDRYLYSLHQMGTFRTWLVKQTLERATDAPLRVEKHYWWA